MAENDLMTPAEADALVLSQLPTNHNRETQNVDYRTAIRTALRAATGCYAGLHYQNLSPGTVLNIATPTFLDLTGWTQTTTITPANDAYTVSTTNGTITVTTQSAGDALVIFNATFVRNAAYTSDGGKWIFLKLMKNSTEVCTEIVSTAATGDIVQICGTFLVPGLVSGDVLKLQYAGDATSVGGVTWVAGSFLLTRKDSSV